MENDVELQLKPAESIGYCCIRNIWMFLVYLVLVVLSFIVKINLNGKPESIANVGNKLFSIVLILGIIITVIIYIYKTIQLYLNTRRIKYIFYDTFMRFEDNFFNKNSKDIDYNKITEISISENLWDRALNTGFIHIKTDVESDAGIYMHVFNPQEVLKNIREIIGK